MLYFTLILLVTVIILVYIYFKKILNLFKDLGIPCLPAWPLFGNMAPVIFKSQSFKSLLEKMYYLESEALYVGAFDMIRPTILIRDIDLIKSITIKNFNSFPDHPNVYNKSDLWTKNLFSLSYDEWREIRTIMNPALSLKKMKDYMFTPMKTHIFQCLEYLSKRGIQENSMIKTNDLFSKYIHDSIFTCLFGINTNSYSNSDNDLYKITQCCLDLQKSAGWKFLLARGVPGILDVLNINFIERPMENLIKELASEIIALKEKYRGFDCDMIRLMLNAQENDKTKMNIDFEHIVAQVIVIVTAGLETTSTQLCCIVHELATNPDVQAKLQNEIDEVMEITEGKPTYSVIMKMSYLDAVFNETTRLHCVPSVIDRVCVKEFVLPPALPELKPFVVKPGMSIWIPPAAIQRDEKYFEDPLKFVPERYYLKKVDINDGINLTFGIGPRQCFGRKFSIMQMKMMIFFMLQKFDLKPSKNTSSTMEYDGKSISLSAKGGFWLSILPRSLNQ